MRNSARAARHIRGQKHPGRLTTVRSLITLGGVMAFALIAASGSVLSAAPSGPPTPFNFNFDGSPAAPQAWNPAAWDVVVHSRDNFAELEAMQAEHGADCSAPPATHLVNTYEGAVFLCRNHLMTAISAGGYGEIVLTPDHMIDLSAGTAQVLYSVSTRRASLRDWYDIWLTPFGENLVLPIEAGLESVDLQGPPRDAIHIRLSDFNGESVFHYEQYTNFVPAEIPGDWWTSVESLLAPSATTRSQFEIDLSSTHLRFGIPALPGGSAYWFADANLPQPLNSSQYVVQIAHHSYNPTKDCVAGTEHCLPNTWHWSNFSISNAVPFTLLRGNVSVVHAGTQSVVNFAAPAPSASFLRFAGIGSIEVSADGGKTFKAAVRQAQSLDIDGHFASYWTPVPAGTTSVTIRGTDWYSGTWWVRDVAVWSAGSTGAVPAPLPSPSSSASPSPSPTPSPSASPSPSPTPSPSASPSPSPTPSPSASPSHSPSSLPSPTPIDTAITNAPCTISYNGTFRQGTCSGTFAPSANPPAVAQPIPEPAPPMRINRVQCLVLLNGTEQRGSCTGTFSR